MFPKFKYAVAPQARPTPALSKRCICFCVFVCMCCMNTTTSQVTVHPQQGTLSLASNCGCFAIPCHVLMRTGGHGSGGLEEEEETNECITWLRSQPGQSKTSRGVQAVIVILLSTSGWWKLLWNTANWCLTQFIQGGTKMNAKNCSFKIFNWVFNSRESAH